MTVFALTAVLLLGTAASSPPAAPSRATADRDAVSVEIPDVELVDQDGRAVRLNDLVEGRIVAVNFVFTACTTICAPLTATFAKLQSELGGEEGVHLITISLDPPADTPEALAAYARRFDRKPGWTFLTGDPARVKRTLVGMGAWTAAKEEHAPMVLVGDARNGRWKRFFGFPSPGALKDEIRDLAARRSATTPSPETVTADRQAAERWFTNTEVVDQHGRVHRFYDDLIRDRVVVVNFAFTACRTACAPVARNLARAQQLLGTGSGVRFITVTVDPDNDDPATLRRFADENGAGPGWYFVTGSREAIRKVLGRLGGMVEEPDAHATTVLIGDDRHGYWAKTHGMARPENIAHAARHISDPR